MTSFDQPASTSALDPGEVVYENERNARINLKTAVAALERERPLADTANINKMLINQAQAMQEIFARLLVMANNCTQPSFAMSYVALALKAQAQARATLQTLAEISAPRPNLGERAVFRHSRDSDQDIDSEVVA